MAAVAAVGIVAGCGGGGDGGSSSGGGGGGGGGGGSPATSVTISGTVTFDLVPAIPGAGLDYDHTQAAPVRGATVELVSAANAAVLAAAKTDASGAYSVTAPVNTSVFVRVKALVQQAGPPSWDFRVVDNTSNDALYALDGPTFDTGTVASTRDLHAASGWDDSSSSYAEPRAAAPFAILDAVYDAASLVAAVDPAVELIPLVLHWSTENRPVFGANGSPNPDTGEIGTSFASIQLGGIFLLGAEDTDTEEYDRHVIVHEWGHYFEFALSRTDSIGGPHALRDLLDLRTAFSEGFSNALSGIVLDDNIYHDTQGPDQSLSGAFDMDRPLAPLPSPNPGWFSEASVHEIVWDLVDGDPDFNGSDQVQMDFGALYDVMRNEHRTSSSLTSIFSFINALKDNNPGEAALIDTLVGAHSIDVVADEYGTGESNDGGTANDDVLPIYEPLTVGGGAPVNVCSTNEFSSTTTGSTNKLGSRRFLRFSVGATASHTFRAVATDIPEGKIADPDLVLHRNGLLAISEGPPLATCTIAAANCSETFQRTLTAGEYILEVYEFTNTQDDESDNPPIGRTCFDVTVTQP